MKKVRVSKEIIQEGKNIVDKLYDPLKGFFGKKDLDSSLKNMRIASGEVWSMPVLLDIDEETFSKVNNERDFLITDGKESLVIKDIEVYEYDKNFLAEKLFGTNDADHPGVAKVLKMGKYFVGGELLAEQETIKGHDLRLTAQESKEIFKKNGWSNVVAFQTRNPPHRSHEHLQKMALKQVDGILINPVIGEKKKGDFKDKYIIGAYKELIKNYYPEKKAILGTLHTFMRYAGPKEAVFHALVRRNMGCTHMIIGRDHAGVGDYYGTYDAQQIFDNFTEDELGITILKYDNVTFCKSCGGMVEENSCEHSKEEKMHLSGTKLREKINKGERVSKEFIRNKVLDYLLKNKDDLFL